LTLFAGTEKQLKAYLITMDWKAVDERLMRRGELILDTESLGNHEKNSKR